MTNNKKISMQDIADYVGISKNSVSLALNGKPGVSERLRDEIIAAAQHLGYARLESMTKSSETHNIIVLTAEYVLTDQQFYPTFLSSIGKECRILGFNAVFTDISKDMEKMMTFPRILSDLEHQGVIVIGVLNKAYVNKLNAQPYPVVLVDTYYHDSLSNVVVTENIQGAYSAVKYLLDHGHREIGFIGPIAATSSNYERWIGYNKALFDHGYADMPQFSLTTASDICTSQDEIEVFLKTLDRYPTAWFCANDKMAISLIRALQSNQVSVPNDVSVIGFDDDEFARFVTPPLTTIRVRRDVISREAINLLRSLAALQRDYPKTKVSVYGELVERESVKRIAE